MNRDKFVEEMVTAHKGVVEAGWLLWQEMRAKATTAKELKAQNEWYPNGFKDYLVEYLDNMLETKKPNE